MRRRWMLILLVVVLLAGLLVYRSTMPAATLSVVRPRLGTIRTYVQELATTQLPQDYLVVMPVPGWLNRIDLREGDPVKEGQVIATLDTADLEDRVRQVEERMAALGPTSARPRTTRWRTTASSRPRRPSRP